jgi:hypothetical protein
MSRNEIAALAALTLGILLAGCAPEPVTGRPPPNPPGSPAVSSSGAPDAGPTIHVDAGADLRAEAGSDAPGEPGAEVRLEAGADVQLEAGTDVETDVQLEAGADVRLEAGTDFRLDDAEIDAGARAPLVGEIVIDEILANPSGQDLGREWVEIANVTSDVLDLTMLHIADATTDVAIAAGTLAPGGLLVLGQSADPTKNGGAPVGLAYGTHLILNNDSEQVSVCLGPCATGLVLDEVSWGVIGASYDGHALIIDRATKAICPAADRFGTAGDCGTPGQVNPRCVTPDGGQDDGGGSSQDGAVD